MIPTPLGFGGDGFVRASPIRVVSVCLLLVLATLGVYLQTHQHQFVAYDDELYVTGNPVVQKGLTLSGLAWAVGSLQEGNWLPLTWWSHMLDCELFGLDSGAHHLVSVGLHLANTLLLFAVLVRMTGRPWRSGLVAAIFALHPLHVQSVAWIAERKDVLSSLFGLLALLLYIRYAEEPTRWKLASVVIAFAAALMAKPMLVTLPFLLLLLDYWPLRRLGSAPTLRSLGALCREKLPLFVLTALACGVTYVAQRRVGAVVSLENVPFPERVANAAVAYVAYLGKALWPSDLAVFYPPRDATAAAVLGASLLLAAVTVAAVALARRRPYLIVGWLWYLGLLVPVIGLVQVGIQAMADRYTYLPLVGVSLALVWGLGDLVEGRRRLQAMSATVAVAALAGLAAASHLQVAHWRTSRTLFEHTLSVTSGNYVIHNNLGNVLARDGMQTAAIAQYRKSLEAQPAYTEAHFNLALALLRLGKNEEAAAHLSEAVRRKPRLLPARLELGKLLAEQGDYEAARRHLEMFLELAPGHALAESRLCLSLQGLGRLDDAIAHCAQALARAPGLVEARFHLGTALAARGRRSEAAAELSRVLAADPAHEDARAALAALGPEPDGRR